MRKKDEDRRGINRKSEERGFDFDFIFIFFYNYIKINTKNIRRCKLK